MVLPVSDGALGSVATMGVGGDEFDLNFRFVFKEFFHSTALFVVKGLKLWRVTQILKKLESRAVTANNFGCFATF